MPRGWPKGKPRGKRIKTEDQNPSLIGGIIEPTLNEPAIEILEKEETTPLSLKERLFGQQNQVHPKVPAKSGTRGKKIDANMLTQVLPVSLSMSIALYARKLIKEPYKACAPSQVEVYGTIGPFFNIIGRRVQIVGSASEDVIDIVSALISSICTGIRMHITMLTIQEGIENAKRNGHVTNVPGHGYVANNGATYSPTTGYDRREESVSTPRPFIERLSNDGSGDTTSTDGSDSNAREEAELVANFFRRDREGRERLGLVASRV